MIFLPTVSAPSCGSDHIRFHRLAPDDKRFQKIVRTNEIGMKKNGISSSFLDMASMKMLSRSGQANMHVRYGYRRIHVLLKREGWQLGKNQMCRIYS